MTSWQDDQMTKWPDDDGQDDRMTQKTQMTGWQEASLTIYCKVYLDFIQFKFYQNYLALLVSDE